MFKIKKLIKSEQGISLIEVVASIVIIGIILISFFGLFIQSNKTGKASETIIIATYLAQIEMENIYQLSRSTAFSKGELEANLTDYTKVPDITDLEFTKVKDSYTINLSFTQRTGYRNLISVVVKVSENGVEKSTMENLYKWQVMP